MDNDLLGTIEGLEDEKLFLEEAVFFESFDKQYQTMKKIEQLEKDIYELSKWLDNSQEV